MFDLSATPPGPLHIRLAAAIRTEIKSGRLPYGVALPPSRTLAGDLRVSRWTVTQAYGQLVLEGFLSGRTGSATRVSWTPGPEPKPARPSATPARYDLSQGRPDLRAFPRRAWVKAVRAAAETTPFDQLSYSETGGHPRLRAVLAERLNRSRGAAVRPGTLSIYAGAGQSLLQLCHALAAAGHTTIGVEDPGSPRHWQAARTAGLQLVPVPVDDDGLDVSALPTGVRAVCVSPAHHPATGVVLAEHRREALLDWARRVDGLIVEDDYDAEFGYERVAPAALQGRSPERVALLGSMSRSLGPAVGIGWVAVPGRWSEGVRTAQEIELHPPMLNQLALAQMIETGGYDRHLRAARARFRARRNALLAALRREMPDFPVRGAEAGLHLLLDLPAGTDAAAVVREARRHDLLLCDLDDSRLTPGRHPPTLEIGYGNLKDSLVDEAVAVLAAVVQPLGR